MSLRPVGPSSVASLLAANPCRCTALCRSRRVIVRAPFADGADVTIFPDGAPPSSGDRPTVVVRATAYGGQFRVRIRRPGLYKACSEVECPVVRLRALEMPTPTFNCSMLFGALCPVEGVRALSAADVTLARASGLQLYLYEHVPPSFHADHFVEQMPAKIRSGIECDFLRKPCLPMTTGLHRWARGRHKSDGKLRKMQVFTEYGYWYHKAQNCADVQLLSKLLALASVPGLRTRNPAAAHLFIVPFLGCAVMHVAHAIPVTHVKLITWCPSRGAQPHLS